MANTRLDTPGDTYYRSLWPTALNWAFETTNQTSANNQQVVWPRGKVLGGSQLPGPLSKENTNSNCVQAVLPSMDYI